MNTSVFNDNSERYEAWFERNPAVYRSELAAIKALLPEDDKVLEIGVGSGLFAAPLGIRIGIDPSTAMLDKARARGIEVVRGVAEALPFPDQSFATALMVTTICFLDDVELALAEAHRVLSPGGAFLIGFIDKDSPIGRAYQSEKERSLFYRNATFYATPELAGYLMQAGFSNLQYVQTLFHPLSEITSVEPVKDGYGTGSFVVIKAEK